MPAIIITNEAANRSIPPVKCVDFYKQETTPCDACGHAEPLTQAQQGPQATQAAQEFYYFLSASATGWFFDELARLFRERDVAQTSPRPPRE